MQQAIILDQCCHLQADQAHWENVQVTWKFQQLDFSHVRQKFGEMVGVRPRGDVVSLADEDERLRSHLRQVVGRRRWGPVQLEVLRKQKWYLNS